MSSDHVNPYSYQSEPEAGQYGEPVRKRSKWASCLIGCLIVFAIFVVLAAIAAYWISQHWRGLVADVSMQAINQGIDDSDLAPQEKIKVKAQVERVTKAFANNEITVQQTMNILKKLTESPLMSSLIVTAVDKKYLDKSGLTAEEKTQGRDALRRFSNGAITGKVNQQDIDSVLSHVADRKGDNQWQFRDKVSDADLKALIADAKARADKAGVPADVDTKVEPSEELKRIIDEELQKKN